MELQFFNCAILAIEETNHKTVNIWVALGVWSGYNLADVKAAVTEHSHKIYEQEIKKGFRIEIKIVNLDKNKLRNLIDGEQQSIAGFDVQNIPEFEM
jgi:hypothetical protein